MFLPLLLALSPFVVGVFRNRISLISGTHRLVEQTQDTEWKAWRLSAVEPLITTVLIIIFTLIRTPFQPFIFLNLLLFTILIARLGVQYRRVRLVLTVMIIRLLVVTVAMFDFYNGMQFSVFPILILFASQILFGSHQVRVTPGVDVSALSTQRERGNRPQLPPPIDETVLRDMTIIDDAHLWDKQMALIEQLKAEEETDTHEV